jgi:hypothetical protein
MALMAPPAPLVPVVLGPMSFIFSYPGEHGRTIECKVDGFSHSSGIRRAYAKCIATGHVNCFKYTQLNIWPHAWMGVAYVLEYMRRGAGLPDKASHIAINDPTIAELALLEGEMPEVLKASDFPTVA